MIKTENWNNHKIRFIEREGEWWAVAKDVADALGFLNAHNATHKMKSKYKGTAKVITTSNKSKAPETQEMITLNEKGLYRLIMRSNKPEAEEFQDWIYDIIKKLRQATGLEGFEVFRMMDKEHQKSAMSFIHNNVSKPTRKHFIKANTIANKAISDKYGLPKKINKGEMSPDMLVDRQPVLDDTVHLMVTKEHFDLDVSVSKVIYSKFVQ